MDGRGGVGIGGEVGAGERCRGEVIRGYVFLVFYYVFGVVCFVLGSASSSGNLPGFLEVRRALCMR